MEMHQVRYFLAVSRTLNFTRAAEECNVAQPSLTRAIKQLEDELGGDLFRRERPHVLMTDLGERMQPLLKQCHDSALGARALASSLKRGQIASLRLALTETIALPPIAPFLTELKRAFKGLELRLARGDTPAVLELLKQGDVELAITAGMDEGWERLDSWPLFEEGFSLLVDGGHRLARRERIGLADLKDETIVSRPYCEHAAALVALLQKDGPETSRGPEVATEGDVAATVAAGLGVAVVPLSFAAPAGLRTVALDEPGLRRTVALYAVAGRQRSAAVATFMKMLRAACWPKSAG